MQESSHVATSISLFSSSSIQTPFRMLSNSFSILTNLALMSSASLAAPPPTRASKSLPLTLHKGFWSGKVQVGASELELVVDTGSYSLLVNKGQYKPSNHSTPSGKGSYIQFSGGNENGTENIDVTISYINDTVSILDYELPNFMVGNITYQSAILPSNGVLGLSQKQSCSNPGDPTDSNGESFIQTLCDQKLIKDCGFGLILGTNGQGELIFGGMEKEKYQGDLVTVKTTENDFWQIDPSSSANPQVVVNSDLISPINISFDSGSPNIFAPYDQGLKVLKAATLSITKTNTTQGTEIAYGTYPCNQTPPRIGFNFNNATIEQSLYVDDFANILERSTSEDGVEICRINLLATKAMDQDGGWLVGQTWFQGRYIQHQVEKHELIFAERVN